MKNLNEVQISELKKLRSQVSFYLNSYHKNKKKLGSYLIADLRKIESIRFKRESIKLSVSIETDVQKTKRLLKCSLECAGTSYFKTLIEGDIYIYYACPDYGHGDYNKSRAFPKNEKTMKLLLLFNKIVDRHHK